MIGTTHTYVELEVSETSFNEIRDKLLAAGYEHAFNIDARVRGVKVIDMHGIGLVKKADA